MSSCERRDVGLSDRQRDPRMTQHPLTLARIATRTGPRIGSKVDHESSASDLIVAGDNRCAATSQSSPPIIDSTEDVIELHSGMRVPIPIQRDRTTSPKSAKDIVVAQVRVRKSRRDPMVECPMKRQRSWSAEVAEASPRFPLAHPGVGESWLLGC